MAEENPPKKDLTGIFELSQAALGEPPPLPPDHESMFSVNESPSAPQIESFESLEELSKASNAEVIPSHSDTEMPEMPVEPDRSGVSVSPPDTEPYIDTASLTQPMMTQTEPETATETETIVSPLIHQATQPVDSMARIRNYSENVTLAHVAATTQVTFPFSMMLTGNLDPQEREKLVDLLSTLGTGITAVDLEPQFEGGKILIPRISEYCLVAIVQAMRGTRAEMHFGPSDTIFATPDTRDEAESMGEIIKTEGKRYSSDSQNAAEFLPITTDSYLPSMLRYTLIDTLSASAAIKTESVEAQSSSEYQEVLDNLQRELKYKAFRKGADGIIRFSVQLTQLALPMSYRLTVMGSAVKRVPPPIPRA